MEIKEITELIDAVSRAEINNFHLQQGDFCLNMDKLEQRKEVSNLTKVEENTIVTGKHPEVMVMEDTTNLTEVTSPIVGTFYSAAGPESEDFVQVGDHVKKSQVLCIIEAMKLMNEIESDVEGEVVEILVKNEAMVEYNQPLFKIKVLE